MGGSAESLLCKFFLACFTNRIYLVLKRFPCLIHFQVGKTIGIVSAVVADLPEILSFTLNNCLYCSYIESPQQTSG